MTADRLPAAPASIRFTVRGTPTTQGSKIARHSWRADGKCVVWLVEDSNHKLEEWRALVSTAARRAMKRAGPFQGPVKLDCVFAFLAPKSRPDDYYVAVRGRHDVEKLLRAVCDALTDAAVWLDDGQVAVVQATKVYNGTAGVFIEVTPL